MSFLVGLRAQTMRPHIENSGHSYNENVQHQRIMDRFDCARIIMQDEQKIGLLKINTSENPWVLMQIQLLPSFQKKGVGTQILHSVIFDAQSHGAHVTLKVLKANPARKFYERFGFCIVREDKESFFMLGP